MDWEREELQVENRNKKATRDLIRIKKHIKSLKTKYNFKKYIEIVFTRTYGHVKSMSSHSQ